MCPCFWYLLGTLISRKRQWWRASLDIFIISCPIVMINNLLGLRKTHVQRLTINKVCKFLLANCCWSCWGNSELNKCDSQLLTHHSQTVNPGVILDRRTKTLEGNTISCELKVNSSLGRVMVSTDLWGKNNGSDLVHQRNLEGSLGERNGSVA